MDTFSHAGEAICRYGGPGTRLQAERAGDNAGAFLHGLLSERPHAAFMQQCLPGAKVSCPSTTLIPGKAKQGSFRQPLHSGLWLVACAMCPAHAAATNPAIAALQHNLFDIERPRHNQKLQVYLVLQRKFPHFDRFKCLSGCLMSAHHRLFFRLA